MERSLPSQEPRLSVRGLFKEYGSVKVLRDVSFDVYRGDVIAVIGPAGAGKSTLLRCLYEPEESSSGEIAVCGEQLRFFQRRGRRHLRGDPQHLRLIRSRLGAVFHIPNLWPHMTVVDNLLNGARQFREIAPGEALPLARKALDRVGLKDWGRAVPSQLSDEQRRRVAFARLIATGSEVLLLDEPTESVEPQTVALTLSIIRQFSAEGRAIIITTNDPRILGGVASRWMALKDGKLEEVVK